MEKIRLKSMFKKEYKDYDKFSMCFIMSYILIENSFSYNILDKEVVFNCTPRKISTRGGDLVEESNTLILEMKLYGDERFVREDATEQYNVEIEFKLSSSYLDIDVNVLVESEKIPHIYKSNDRLTQAWIETRKTDIQRWIEKIIHDNEKYLSNPIPILKAIDEIRKMISVLDSIITNSSVKGSPSVMDILIKWFKMGLIRY